jgi:hypothetical protein
MRWTLATGAAMSMTLKWPTEAKASNCNVYGNPGWGCYCANTGICPTSMCPDGNAIVNHRRCDYWVSPNSAGQYCWCSDVCHTAAGTGHYVCCDGWVQAGTACDQGGRTRCICLWYIAA